MQTPRDCESYSSEIRRTIQTEQVSICAGFPAAGPLSIVLIPPYSSRQMNHRCTTASVRARALEFRNLVPVPPS